MNWPETIAEIERARAERPTVFAGPRGDLVGILTPAAPAAPRAGVHVLLLSRPRFEQRRMSVQIARRLAAVGFDCLRFDQHGWGDSAGETLPMNLDHPATTELLAALKYLRQHCGAERFILYGSCIDARNALSAFTTAEAPAVEGLIFVSTPVARLATTDVFNWTNLARWARDRETWRRVLFSSASRRLGLRALRFTVRGWLGKILGRAAGSVSVTFQTHLDALARSRARALFLYGTDDEEYTSFQVAEREVFPRLRPAARARIAVEVWPGRVHSPYEVKRQQEVAERIIAFATTLHPYAGRVNGEVEGLRATA